MANTGSPLSRPQITYTATIPGVFPASKLGLGSAPLLFVSLDVIESESLQRRAGQAELRRFLGGAIVIPLVDEHALDQPHRGCAVSTGTMNKRRLIAGFRDGFDKLIGYRGVGCASVERDVYEVDASGFGCGWFPVDVRPRFGGEPQVDDGCEPHLLDPGYRARRSGAGARDGGFHLRKVGDPRDG